jgi:predicted tellurium resistance membrane protein TerC
MLRTLGMTVMAFGLFSLSRLSPTNSTLHIVCCPALVKIGTAIFASPNSSAIMSSVHPYLRGVVAGTIATAHNLGMVIGVALAELLFNSIFRSLNSRMVIHDKPETLPNLRENIRD